MASVSTVPTAVLDTLKSVVKGDIKNYEISVHESNKKGEGFLGDVLFISLKEKKNGNQFNFVVKQALSDENTRKFHPIRDSFLNEIFFYTKLWPKLQSFQERIPSKDHFVQVPKFYRAVSQDAYETLVLQNLKYEGYVLHNKKKPLERDMFEMLFKTFGRFHATSFAYQALKPEEFSEVVNEGRDVWVAFCGKKIQDSIKSALKQSFEDIESDIDSIVIQKCKKFVENVAEIFKKSLTNGKYTCIIHGDCWSNNMMFKYDDNGKLIDVKLLDFQIVRSGSPVYDLSYFLYSGGTKENFDDLDHFLQVYHASLSKTLRAYGCDPEKIYPLKALKDDWKEHCFMGVITGLMVWRAKVTFDEDIVDLTDLGKDGEDIQKFFESNYDKKTFQERTKDIVLHLHENNYI